MKNECWAIVLAAGRGSRMLAATNGKAKQFLHIGGVPLWWKSAENLAASPLVHGLVLVFPGGSRSDAEAELAALLQKRSLGIPVATATGGETRRHSVASGLKALPASCEIALVHDGVRPFASTALATRLILALAEGDGISGVIPGIAVTDTIKVADAGGICVQTPDRASLRAVQTPQVFWRRDLENAHASAEESNMEATDDAMLLEACGKKILIAEGEEGNIKITRPADIRLLAQPSKTLPCCGYGYDVHAFGGSRPLRLGGIAIGGDVTVSAHSDGDVLLHALMDAILGCFGGGDIGRLFPDRDPRFDNASSCALLDHVLDLAAAAGVRIAHADLTVIAQAPKLSPFADQIRMNIARLLALAPDHVGFKATTEEHLGFTGEMKGIKAVALVTALRATGGSDEQYAL